MILNRYLSAGVLGMTLSICIVLSGIASCLIIYGYYDISFKLKLNRSITVTENLHSAEQLAVSNPSRFQHNKPQFMDLFGEKKDSVTIEKRKWGVLDLLRIQSFRGVTKKRSTCSLGFGFDEKMNSALYLQDQDLPLNVVGVTRIEGDAYLPQKGIQTAYIGTRNYEGELRLYGNNFESSDRMPEFNNRLLRELNLMGDKAQTISWQEVQELNTISNSFTNDEILKVEATNLVINDSIIGYVWLDADKIIFNKGSFTKNIVVTANEIHFSAGFQGSGQFFAKKQITVQTNVQMKKPTTLLVNADVGTIVINENSAIEGYVIIVGNGGDYSDRKIQLKKDSRIKGHIYCDGILELYGSVEGHVTTKYTGVIDQGNLLENYLLDAKITSDPKSRFDYGPGLWFSTDKTGVMAWYD